MKPVATDASDIRIDGVTLRIIWRKALRDKWRKCDSGYSNHLSSKAQGTRPFL